MLWECIPDYRIKFEGQSQSYKKDTGLAIRNHVNKDRALFLFTWVQYTSENLFLVDLSI